MPHTRFAALDPVQLGAVVYHVSSDSLESAIRRGTELARVCGWSVMSVAIVPVSLSHRPYYHVPLVWTGDGKVCPPQS